MGGSSRQIYVICRDKRPSCVLLLTAFRSTTIVDVVGFTASHAVTAAG